MSGEMRDVSARACARRRLWAVEFRTFRPRRHLRRWNVSSSAGRTIATGASATLCGQLRASDFITLFFLRLRHHDEQYDHPEPDLGSNGGRGE